MRALTGKDLAGKVLAGKVLAATVLAALAWSLAVAGAQAEPSAAERAGLRYLDWPGKPAPAPRHAANRPHMRAPYAAPAAAPRPMMQPAPQTVAVQAFAPQSIFDAPPPAPGVPSSAQIAEAIAAPPLPPVSAPEAAEPAAAVVPAQRPGPVMNASADDRPRHYSLHRDYGEQPDHTDMPPQVMLDHIDLAQPPEHEPTAKEQRDAKDADADPDAPKDRDGDHDGGAN